jgi:ribosome-binding factor A
VGEAMRHALAQVLAERDTGEPLIDNGIVSVNEVRVSPDLRHATAYIIPVGAPTDQRQAVIKALARLAPQLKTAVARRVNTKFAAELRFRLDETLDEGGRIDALLRNPKVARDLDAPLPRREDLDESD